MSALTDHSHLRLGLALGLLAFISFSARRRGYPLRVGLGGVAAATIAGAGLYPLGWLAPDSALAALLATPIPQWEAALLGPSWGPTPLLASFALPMLSAALLLGVRRLRGALVGLCCGTAAFLLASCLDGLVDVRLIPGAGALDAAWLLCNSLACVGLARLMTRR
jgi:hypothetical protein